jgi:hypothetical protein
MVNGIRNQQALDFFTVLAQRQPEYLRILQIIGLPRMPAEDFEVEVHLPVLLQQ